MVLGLDAAMKGNAAEVLSHYTELVRLFPNDERAHTLLGNLYFGRQDYDAAVKEFVRATAINPTFSQPYNQLGYAYRFVDKLDDAEAAFKKYVQLIPDDPNPHDSYAELLMKPGPVRRVDQGLREGAVARCQLRRVVRGDWQQLPVRGAAPIRRGRRSPGSRRSRGTRARGGWRVSGVRPRTSTTVPPTRRSTRCVRDTRSPRPSGIRPRCRAIWCRWATSCEKPHGSTRRRQNTPRPSRSSISPRVPQPVKDAAHRNHVFEQGRVAVARGDLAAARTRIEEYATLIAAARRRSKCASCTNCAGRSRSPTSAALKRSRSWRRPTSRIPRVLYLTALAFRESGDARQSAVFAKKAARFNGLSFNYAYVRSKAATLVGLSTQ